MKKIFKVSIILFVLIFTLTGCKSKTQEETNNTGATPIFYKITKEDTDATVYLLGSIHVADESIYPLNNKIMNAYNSSDYLAVELDIDKISSNYLLQMEITNILLNEDGRKIKDDLGEDLYNQMIELLKGKASYMSAFDIYKPAFFESLLENAIAEDAKLNPDYGIDLHFLKLAKEENKEILEIETIELQCNLLVSKPIELDRLIISDYVINYDKNVSGMKKMYSMWKQGNKSEFEKQINTIDKEGLKDDEIEMVETYNKRLITDRNYCMVDSLQQNLSENKNVFCVVGLGHVIGDEGIAKLMEKNGYKIERIEY